MCDVAAIAFHFLDLLIGFPTLLSLLPFFILDVRETTRQMVSTSFDMHIFDFCCDDFLLARGRKKESVSQKRSHLKGADLGKNGEKVMKSAKSPLSALGKTLQRMKVMVVPLIKEKRSQQRCDGTQEGDGGQEKDAKEE